MLCQLYHALRQPTRLGTARPVSTPLSVKIVKKVSGPKAEPPKRVRNCDVIHVTGITGIAVSLRCHKTFMSRTDFCHFDRNSTGKPDSRKPSIGSPNFFYSTLLCRANEIILQAFISFDNYLEIGASHRKSANRVPS